MGLRNRPPRFLHPEAGHGKSTTRVGQTVQASDPLPEAEVMPTEETLPSAS